MGQLAPGIMVTANVRLIRLIAQGGMGSVWLADHLGLESKVAVKFISSTVAARDSNMRERFKREASICARLRSIHVVQVFDHGVMADGTPYIVMEFLEGQILTDRIENNGPMSLREVSMLVGQIAKVLSRAHDLGIAHRDIKPDNIFLTDSDYELFVKVLDFGIAKQMQGKVRGAVTKTGIVVGTPEFMSPEQAVSSKDIDHRSDLYSLAVVAYYALTGELPFDTEGKEPIWMQMAGGHFAAPHEHVKGLPEELTGWFKKALQAKPEKRFQSAKVMARVLHEISDPESSVSDELSTSLGPESRRRVAEELADLDLSGPGSSPSSSPISSQSRPTPTIDSLYPAKYDLFGPESTRSSTGRTLVMEEADHSVAEIRAEGRAHKRKAHAATQVGPQGGPYAPPAAAESAPAAPTASQPSQPSHPGHPSHPSHPSQPGTSSPGADLSGPYASVDPQQRQADGLTFPGTNLPISGPVNPSPLEGPSQAKKLHWAIVALCALVVIAIITTWALTTQG